MGKGEGQAFNDRELEAQLRDMGLQLVSAKLVASREGNLAKMTRRDLIDFLFQLEMLSRAGVPLLSCLGDMRRESDSAARGGKPRLRRGSLLSLELTAWCTNAASVGWNLSSSTIDTRPL